MPFPMNAVSLELAPSARALSVRDVLAYAAGLNANEDAFLDDARSDGLCALPFQCVSLEWPVLVSSRTGMAGKLKPEEAARGVHAIQDSQFHRPMRPGDELETRGQLVLARTMRAGVFTTFKLSTIDKNTLEPVVTTWSSSIYRGVAADGADITIQEPPAAPADLSAPLGKTSTVRTLPIARNAAHVYTECARIWNPIHSEREVALAAGLPDIILHGTATWALAGLEILRSYLNCDVTRIKRISGRFVGMIIPGETIEIHHGTSPGHSNLIRFEVRNGSGALAIDQGFAVIE